MEKIIEARAKKIIEDAKADLRDTIQRTQKELDAYLERLDLTSKVGHL